MTIREIDPASASEIALVAQRMWDTLLEVEGPQRGAGVHSPPWLEDRLRWHLDPAQTTAQVLLAIGPEGDIVGHAIFRIEGRDFDPFGLVVTTYVVPAARQSGWAAKLLEFGHAWFLRQGMSRTCTWTSGTNTALIALYRKLGYDIVDHGPNGITGTPMVKLGRRWDAGGGSAGATAPAP